MDIDEELSRLRDDWEKSVIIVELLNVFPDLKLVRDHYGALKYVSRDANFKVDTLEFETRSDLPDTPLVMSAYMKADKGGTRLYSDPPFYIVADQNQRGFGQIPRPGWEKMLESYGFKPSVIYKVSQHLKKHPPVNYPEDASEQGQNQGDPGAGR